METSLVRSIEENVKIYSKSKKKKNVIDFSRYNTITLREKLKKYEFDPENYLKIYYILKSREGGSVMCTSAKMQLQREARLGITPVHFGYKNETYATEKEMLSEHNYTFESLSSSEKHIYNGMNKSCRIS
jgi:hypothetical protein